MDQIVGCEGELAALAEMVPAAVAVPMILSLDTVPADLPGGRTSGPLRARPSASSPNPTPNRSPTQCIRHSASNNAVEFHFTHICANSAPAGHNYTNSPLCQLHGMETL